MTLTLTVNYHQIYFYRERWEDTHDETQINKETKYLKQFLFNF